MSVRRLLVVELQDDATPEQVLEHDARQVSRIMGCFIVLTGSVYQEALRNSLLNAEYLRNLVRERHHCGI